MCLHTKDDADTNDGKKTKTAAQAPQMEAEEAKPAKEAKEANADGDAHTEQEHWDSWCQVPDYVPSLTPNPFQWQ
eukprot:7721586-Karenia_brevis.AAC.1